MLTPAALLLASALTCLIGLWVGGAGNVRPLEDPGTIVRYGLPFARTLVNLSGGVLVGAMLMTVWALKGEGREARYGLDISAGAAAVLTVSSAITFVLSFLDMSNVDFSLANDFGLKLAQFATEIPLGQLWILMIVIGALTSVLCFAIQDRRWMLLPFILSIVALLPLAQQGHAQGASQHAQAVNSLFIHLAGASAWVGGLVTVMLLSRVLERNRLQIITERYSTIALFAFIGVAASGVVSAMLRVGTLDDLFGTGYGMLIIYKTLALIALGMFGAIHRTWIIPKISDSVKGMRSFGWFVVGEMLVMGVASGFAGALGRTQTPVPIEPPSETGGQVAPAEWLTGDPLPPEAVPSAFITEWKFDLLWMLVAFFGVVLYLVGVWRLHKRGDKWPIGRTVAWLLGLILLFYTTNGALNLYERYVFSIHMLGHMMLTMLIPLILVLGAPVTLMLRVLPKRKDGSWGGREWVLWAIHTPYSKVITHPIVAAVIFSGSLWMFYFTPMLEWAMRTHIGHQWMILHFLISGYLFCLTMIGIDPIPMRYGYPMRLVILFATMTSHAFFGVTIMSMTGMLVPEWFGAMGREWGWEPLLDQSNGGSIAWGIGELPTLALAVVVAIQWMKNDDKVQRREDRAADRSGEAELKAYNEMLRAQARRDEQLSRR